MNDPKTKVRCHNKGISVEQFIAMLYVQNFACAICDRVLTINGKGLSAIDHCHVTGRVRGVLCGACNRALGTVEKHGISAFATYLNHNFNVHPLNQAQGMTTEARAAIGASKEGKKQTPEQIAKRTAARVATMAAKRRKRSAQEGQQ